MHEVADEQGRHAVLPRDGSLKFLRLNCGRRHRFLHIVMESMGMNHYRRNGALYVYFYHRFAQPQVDNTEEGSLQPSPFFQN